MGNVQHDSTVENTFTPYQHPVNTGSASVDVVNPLPACIVGRTYPRSRAIFTTNLTVHL